MITNCPVCGKAFDVLWPEKYRYKRMNRFLCSYDCMRAIDKGEVSMKKKITDEMAHEAVRIALDGGDVRMYLADCGSKNPSAHWALIKKNMMKNDPETYEKLAKLPDKRKAPTVKLDGPIRIETPETNKVEVVETPEGCSGLFHGTTGEKNANAPCTKPLNYSGYEVSAIRRDELGEFYHDTKFNCVDWRTPAGDEVSLSPAGWRQLRDELPTILKILGVEV